MKYLMLKTNTRVGQLCLRDGGIGYTSTSNWIDAVHGAERELTRRLLNPYEEGGIFEPDYSVGSTTLPKNNIFPVSRS